MSSANLGHTHHRWPQRWTPRVVGSVTLFAGLALASCTSVYFASSDVCIRDVGFACELSDDFTASAGPTVASVFLIGDAGEPDPPAPAAPVRDLVLGSLRTELEASRQTGVEARLVFLGDNIYPEGLRDATQIGECAGTRFCPRDQEQLDAQIAAIPVGVQSYFIAGNHDWGNVTGGESYRRISNQGTYLEEHSQELVPVAGCPGPVVRDLVVANEALLRMVFLDTQWLLLPEASRPGRDSDPPVTCTYSDEEEVYAQVRRDLASAEAIPVLLVLHHPIRTYGDHGGSGSWVSRLLYRAGWSAQDVNSAPYARMIDRLDELLEAASTAERPIIVAAGHEHALQVIYDADSRVHHLVSGSGSKVSRLGRGPGTEFAAGFPGYMRVDVHEGGALTMIVRAACPSRSGEALGAIVEHEGGVTCSVGELATAFAKALN